MSSVSRVNSSINRALSIATKPKAEARKPSINHSVEMPQKRTVRLQQSRFPQDLISPTSSPLVFELLNPKNRIIKPAFPFLKEEKHTIHSQLFVKPDLLKKQSDFLEESSNWRKTAPHPTDIIPNQDSKVVIEWRNPLFYVFKTQKEIPQDLGNNLKDLMDIMRHSATNPEFRPVIRTLMQTMTKAASFAFTNDGKVNHFAVQCFRNMVNIGKHITALSQTVQAGNLQKYLQLIQGDKIRKEVTDYCQKINTMLDETTQAIEQQEKEMPEKDKAFAKLEADFLAKQQHQKAQTPQKAGTVRETD